MGFISVLFCFWELFLPKAIVLLLLLSFVIITVAHQDYVYSNFMDLITIIGLVAGSLTTISFLPQAIKTWRSKSAKDISLAMFLCFCLGVS